MNAQCLILFHRDSLHQVEIRLGRELPDPWNPVTLINGVAMEARSNLGAFVGVRSAAAGTQAADYRSGHGLEGPAGWRSGRESGPGTVRRAG